MRGNGNNFMNVTCPRRWTPLLALALLCLAGGLALRRSSLLVAGFVLLGAEQAVRLTGGPAQIDQWTPLYAAGKMGILKKWGDQNGLTLTLVESKDYSDCLNAFTTGGSYVYVHRGLLAYLNSRSAGASSRFRLVCLLVGTPVYLANYFGAPDVGRVPRRASVPCSRRPILLRS